MAAGRHPMVRIKSRYRVAVVGPTAAVARSFLPRIARRLPEARLSAFSLDRYLADRRSPARIVLCPAGRSVREDVAFLEDVRWRALWPRPGGELAGAIAGLRGVHDVVHEPSDRPPAGRGRTTALLLEGDVTSARAARVLGSGAPRHWIVERVQCVRIPAPRLRELRRLGIRLSALEGVEVIALAASPELARRKSRWSSRLPAGAALWTGAPSERPAK